MSEILLETHALTKQFRRHKAVSEIDMHIKRGAIYGFIGRNGAGKTTFLKMISGLTAPSSGDYSLFGYSGKDLSKVRSRVGCLIEEPGLYKNMSAFDNMMIKAKMFGINDKKYVLGLLDEVGLSDVGRKKTKNFSLGMKQRLGIALAMVGNPDFLVLDEPKRALVTLDEIGVHNYEVVDKSHIYIYERFEESAYINERLVNSGVCPREIKVNQEELESYFLNMTAD